MTIIAYRDGFLAADTQISYGSTIIGRACKIHQASNGAYVAVAGDLSLIDRVVDWIGRGEPEHDRPRLPDEVKLYLLVVYPDGTLASFSRELIRCIHHAPYYVEGSGQDVALGALAMGASAEEAVRVACQFDVWSSEPINVVKIPVTSDLEMVEL